MTTPDKPELDALLLEADALLPHLQDEHRLAAAAIVGLATALRAALARESEGREDTERLEALSLLVNRDQGIEIRMNQNAGKWYYVACEIDSKGNYYKGLSREATPAGALRVALDAVRAARHPETKRDD